MIFTHPSAYWKISLLQYPHQDDRGIEVRFPTKAQDFSLIRNVQTGSNAEVSMQNWICCWPTELGDSLSVFFSGLAALQSSATSVRRYSLVSALPSMRMRPPDSHNIIHNLQRISIRRDVTWTLDHIQWNVTILRPYWLCGLPQFTKGVLLLSLHHSSITMSITETTLLGMRLE
jgi:hypothetical protein